jgi:hypothetical protein
MAIKNTNTVKVDLARSINSAIQTGNLPSGASASKYPLHIADVSLGTPNTIGGPTAYPYYPMNTLTEGYVIGMTGDFRDKILTGDPLTVGRGSIRNFYTVKNTIYDPVSNQTTLSLFTNRETIKPLDSFLGASGYPSPSQDSFVILNSELERSDYLSSLLENFTYKLIPTTGDTFSLQVDWEVEPSVKATRLRWRSVPRQENVSNLGFSVTTPGYYTEVPSATIVSNTGRSAKIQLTGEVNQVIMATGGTGYTYASAYAIGNGTGASFSVGLSASAVDSITVTAGGTYSSAPSIVIVGDGTGASVSSLVMEITGVDVLQQGGNYLSPPQVLVDTNYLVSTEVELQSSLTLENGGRVDYIKIISGGTGYTGASVSIGGASGATATATATITNGEITDIKVVYGGLGYTAASVTITPTGTGGTGASAYANVDAYSIWQYEAPQTSIKTKTISGLKTNIPYEIQILVSVDDRFKGEIHYSDSYYFQYYKK